MDVIVIGCGASGVAALRKLHDAGLQVLGLEAADRIGGRICTQQFADNVVDIGAAWCHGEKDNIVCTLADPLGLLGRPSPDYKLFVQSNGELAPNDISLSILDALSQAVREADKNNSKSIKQCIDDAFSAKSSPAVQKHPHLADALVEWYGRNEHLGGQSDPRTGKSLKGLEESWPCEGEFMLHWKGRGFKTILDVLLNRYPNPSKEIPVSILTNKEVDTIKWKGQTGYDAGNPAVQVKCKDGSLYAAKSVIVTVSVGVLKDRHEKLFNPPLPADKVNTINNLQLCVLNKIYIEFEKPWWPASPAAYSILWQRGDKDKFSKEDKWITEIYGLITVENQPNVLLAWIYGEGAKSMENISEDVVKKGVEKLLDVVFGKQFDVAPVKKILRSQWASNALIRGAYAYRSVANEQNGGDAATLSRPLLHGEFPIVCFAGEATSHHRHSAVHGAVEAGFREAERLISSLKRSNW